MELTKRKLLVGTGGVLGLGLLSLSNSSNKELTVLSIAGNDIQYPYSVTVKRPLLLDRDAVKIKTSEINRDAGTRFENSIIVTNNSPALVDFYIDPSTVENEVLDFQVDGSSIIGESNSISIEQWESVSITLLIDLADTDIDALQTTTASFVTTESA